MVCWARLVSVEYFYQACKRLLLLIIKLVLTYPWLERPVTAAGALRIVD